MAKNSFEIESRKYNVSQSKNFSTGEVITRFTDKHGQHYYIKNENTGELKQLY